MSEELKVVAWMKANGTHMPRIRMLNETYLQGVWDFALVRLSDAQSALQAQEAEIAALKEVLIETRRVLEECDTIWRGPDETLFDYLDAAINSARAAGDGEQTS